MKVNKRLAGIFLLVGLLIGGLIGGILLSSKPSSAAASQTDQCAEDDDTAEATDTEDLDDVEEEVECGPQDEDEANETEDAEDRAEGPDVAITGSALEQASAAALDYIGEGRVTGTEIDDEEGYYEIEIRLDNGRQVDVHLDENFNILSQIDD